MTDRSVDVRADRMAEAQGTADDLARALDALGVHAASVSRDRWHRIVCTLDLAASRRLLDVLASRATER